MKKYISNLIKVFVGIVIATIITILAMGYYWEAHPQTDCDSCLKGTTP